MPRHSGNRRGATITPPARWAGLDRHLSSPGPPGTTRGDKSPASLADQGVRQGPGASEKGLAWNRGDVLLP